LSSIEKKVLDAEVRDQVLLIFPRLIAVVSLLEFLSFKVFFIFIKDTIILPKFLKKEIK